MNQFNDRNLKKKIKRKGYTVIDILICCAMFWDNYCNNSQKVFFNGSLIVCNGLK